MMKDFAEFNKSIKPNNNQKYFKNDFTMTQYSKDESRSQNNSARDFKKFISVLGQRHRS